MDGVTHDVSKWDLIVGHPECRFLSNAGACRLYPKKGQIDIERYEKGVEAKAFFMQIWNADCEHICVENPFRRTSATLALRRGMPIELVSKMLGHEQLTTTQLYLDLTEDELEAAHRKYVV